MADKITWTNETRTLSQLVPWPRNPRQIREKNVKRLQESFEEFGQPEPVVIGPGNELYNGHQRLKSWLAKFGDVTVDVRVSSRPLSEKEREKLTIYLHKGATGEWDFDSLSEWDLPDLLEWGFDAFELGLDDGEDEPAGEDPGPQIDRAEELREKWNVQPGQLWILGKHRLICGDCTGLAVVERVMGGERANGAFTSPPYAMQRKDTYGGTPTDKYVDWWEGVQAAVKSVLAEDGSFFVNIKPHCEDGERVLYVFDLVLAMRRRWGWKYVDEFCWTHHGVPGFWANRFKNGFEPIYQFARGGHQKFLPDSVKVEAKESSLKRIQTARNIGEMETGRKVSQTGSKFGTNYANYDDFDGMALPTNVLSLPMESRNVGHSAAFPVTLPSFFIKAYSDTGDSWLEPFSGSGTVIIACENLGRKARAVEISPAYCAVAIQRWADLTGQTPTLHTD